MNTYTKSLCRTEDWRLIRKNTLFLTDNRSADKQIQIHSQQKQVNQWQTGTTQGRKDQGQNQGRGNKQDNQHTMQAISKQTSWQHACWTGCQSISHIWGISSRQTHVHRKNVQTPQRNTPLVNQGIKPRTVLLSGDGANHRWKESS